MAQATTAVKSRRATVTAGRVGSGVLQAVFWLCVAVVMIFPFYWGMITSFKPPPELITDPPIFWPHQFVAITNYAAVLAELPIIHFFFNSLYVCTVSTVFVLFTASLAGYIFEKIALPAKNLIFIGILATMMVPFPVRMIPIYLIFRDLHLVNTLPSLYLGALVSAYGIFLMRQFMKTVPSELLDAARIDGASEFYIFARVAMPLCKPPLAALAIFHFMAEWDSFLWPLLMIDDTNLRTIPLGLALYRSGFGVMQWNKIMASAMIAMIPVVIVYLVGQRQFIQGITLTGIKG